MCGCERWAIKKAEGCWENWSNNTGPCVQDTGLQVRALVIHFYSASVALAYIPSHSLHCPQAPWQPEDQPQDIIHACSVFSYNVAIRRSAKAVGGKRSQNTLCQIFFENNYLRGWSEMPGRLLWYSCCWSLTVCLPVPCPSWARQACTNSVTFPLLYFIPHYLNYHPQTGPTNEEGLGTTLVNIILNNNNYIIIYLSYNNM